MTSLPLDNYFTKSQLSQRHGRHTRTLGKDITSAVAKRDQELLSLLRLQVSPGGLVIDGPKVTTARVKLLKAKHSLTWFGRDEFVALVLKKKPQRRVGESQATGEPKPTNSNTAQQESQQGSQASQSNVENIIAALPSDSGEKAQMLEQLYRQASTELVQAREISSDFKAVFGDFKEVVNKQADGQQQNNKLLNDLIQEVRDRGLLGAGTPSTTDDSPPSPTKGREVVDAITVSDHSSNSEAAIDAKNKAASNLAKNSASTTGNFWQPDSKISRWLPTIAKRIDSFSAPKQ